MPKPEQITGVVEVFSECNMPWYFVRVPKSIVQPYKALSERGLIAITAKVGNSSWPTSLMPYGDGTHFIPLPAKVRKAESINAGGKVTIKFDLRERR
jgi:hypothetical protein